MEFDLKDLFMIWWLFGYTTRGLLELYSIMLKEKYKTGHFKFTL